MPRWRRRPPDPAVRRDVDSELRFHFDQRVRDLEDAGRSREDATAQARSEFGDEPSVRSALERIDTRIASRRRWGAMLDALRQNTRDALRALRRRPALTASVTLILALGIGANTAMFSVVDATLLRPLPYRDADRVVFVRHRIDPQRVSDPTFAQLTEWTSRLQSVERVEGRTQRSVLLSGPEGATRIRILQATPGYVPMLGGRLVAGRGLTADDGRPGATPVVALAESLWRSRYGSSPAVVGGTITMDSTPRIVAGVYADVEADRPGLRFEAFEVLPAPGAGTKPAPVLGVAWLKPGVSFEAAQSEVRALTSGELERPSNVFWAVQEFRAQQFALLAGVFLLLVVACVNVASLLLGSGQARAQEFAMRRALGCGRARLTRVLLIESVLLATAGGALGLVIASGAVRMFATMDPGPQLQTALESIRLDGVIVAYALGIALVTALACGVVPALRGSGIAAGAGLTESGSRTTSAHGRWARVFIGVEVAVSVVMLVAAGLVARAFLQMRLAEPGFAADRVLSVRIALPGDRYATPERRAQFFDELRRAAAALPGVRSVGLGYGALPPTDFWLNGTLEGGGLEAPMEISAWLSHVEPAHFALMDIPLWSGTSLPDARPAASPAGGELPVVISESFQRKVWPDRTPVGLAIRVVTERGSRAYRIVGVAGDASGGGLASRACIDCQVQMYVPLPANRQYTEVLVRLADGAPPPAAGLRQAIASIDPDVPSDDGLETAAQSLHGFLGLPRFRAVLFGGFAALALTLVGAGLVAVIFRAVKERTREIGIRLALGARPAQVKREMLRQGLAPALVGLGIGLASAVVLTRLLSAFLRHVSPTDPLVFVSSAGILLLVAVSAMLGPIHRAARVDPAGILRGN